MKKLLAITLFTGCILAFACGDTENKTDTKENAKKEVVPDPNYDPTIGKGKFKKVDIPANLNAVLAASGENIYGAKCSGCHKLSEEKLVGPGWKGVTGRYKPEWIMNFITNIDEMLEKDPKAQAQLEICMVRMPNQSLSDDDARNLYEYMRKNDGVK